MTGMSKPLAASNEPMPSHIVHYWHEGRALCWRSGALADWPENERGVRLPLAAAADPPEVTCLECKHARQHFIGAPTCAPRFWPWRDACGREHENIPRCVAYTRDSGKGFGRRGHGCDRKGVVQHR